MINKLKKIIPIIILVFIICNIANSTSLDYMQGVDMDSMIKFCERIINYENKKYISQDVISFGDSCIFKDHTTINSVKVNPNDNKRLNKIAITIDDSFSDKYTEGILEILDKHNCKATFFITHKLLKSNPDRIYDIISRGHEIGNHSMTHAPFKNLHSLRKIWEMTTLNSLVKVLTNSDICLFRFPTGSYDDEAIDFSYNLGMYPIGWSIDTRDWQLKNIDEIYKTTCKYKLKSGDIVLLHNGYDFSKKLFDKLLTYFEEKGFSFIKVSDLVYTSDFIVTNGVQESNKIVSE